MSTTDVNGEPMTLFIDADDPNSGYARYADDPLHGDTENAKWIVTGTGPTAQISLVATRNITRHSPIRAPYGWEYWFQPRLFTTQLMQKAFDGYLNDIARDDDTSTAYAFAQLTDRTELLLAAWSQLHRKVRLPQVSTGTTNSQDSILSTASSSHGFPPPQAHTHVRVKTSWKAEITSLTHNQFSLQYALQDPTREPPSAPPSGTASLNFDTIAATLAPEDTAPDKTQADAESPRPSVNVTLLELPSHVPRPVVCIDYLHLQYDSHQDTDSNDRSAPTGPSLPLDPPPPPDS